MVNCSMFVVAACWQPSLIPLPHFRSMEMDMLPGSLDLLPDAGFLKGGRAMLAIGGNALHESHVGDDRGVA